MNEEAIVVSGLSKQYTVYSKAADRLKKAIFKKRDYGQKVNALNNISFSIRKGETFGIIGINGSGKSTLLQILSGIIPPSAGTVAVDGTLAALLELGAGFNPDFTGRENIYISGCRKKDKLYYRVCRYWGFYRQTC
jgi:ABC-type polysaccharide/polyol phosphate transport system ATPase subunit